MRDHRLTCHCGAVELALHFPNGMGELRRCNCSICARKGAVATSVNLEDLKIIQGQEALSVYTFNTHSAKHYFCKHCGIYTHHQRRSNPTEYGVNVGCIEGITAEDLTDIPLYDGRDDHPSDRPAT